MQRHRAELTVQERARLVAEWVELTGEKVPRVGAVCAGGRGNREGIREAARQLPVPGDTEKAREHHVARAIKIASLSPEAQAVAVETGQAENLRGQDSSLCAGNKITPWRGNK